jgi:hypothetical protein
MHVPLQCSGLTALLLAWFVLAAMLPTLARVLGLLAGLVLAAVLTALMRVVLLLLALVAFVGHGRRS